MSTKLAAAKKPIRVNGGVLKRLGIALTMIYFVCMMIGQAHKIYSSNLEAANAHYRWCKEPLVADVDACEARLTHEVDSISELGALTKGAVIAGIGAVLF